MKALVLYFSMELKMDYMDLKIKAGDLRLQINLIEAKIKGLEEQPGTRELLMNIAILENKKNSMNRDLILISSELKKSGYLE